MSAIPTRDQIRANEQRLWDAAFASQPPDERPAGAEGEPPPINAFPADWLVPGQPDVKQLTCPVCRNIVVDPPNLETCGCAICRSCLAECRKRTNACPVDRIPFKASCAFASNSFIQSLTWQLAVRCPNHGLGCKWTDSFGENGRNLHEHRIDCPKRLLECELCPSSHLVTWDDAPAHIRSVINSARGEYALDEARHMMHQPHMGQSEYALAYVAMVVGHEDEANASGSDAPAPPYRSPHQRHEDKIDRIIEVANCTRDQAVMALAKHKGAFEAVMELAPPWSSDYKERLSQSVSHPASE